MRHLFLVVRSDLAPGLQAAQLVHAVVDFVLTYPDLAKQWRDKSNFVKLLRADHEKQLKDLLQYADQSGLRFVPFYEPDLGGALTAIAVEPSDKARIILKGLSLALS